MLRLESDAGRLINRKKQDRHEKRKSRNRKERVRRAEEESVS